MKNNPYVKLLYHLREAAQLEDSLRKLRRVIQSDNHPDRGGNPRLSTLVNETIDQMLKNPGFLDDLLNSSDEEKYLKIIQDLTEKYEKSVKQFSDFREEHKVQIGRYATTIKSITDELEKLREENKNYRNAGSSNSVASGSYYLPDFCLWDKKVHKKGDYCVIDSLRLSTIPLSTNITDDEDFELDDDDEGGRLCDIGSVIDISNKSFFDLPSMSDEEKREWWIRKIAEFFTAGLK